MSSAIKRNRVAYDEDFAAWAKEQSRLLRGGDLNARDVENVAEEIEGLSLGANTGSSAAAWRFCFRTFSNGPTMPSERSRGWTLTIDTQRECIDELLSESPRGRPTLPECLCQWPTKRGIAKH